MKHNKFYTNARKFKIYQDYVSLVTIKYLKPKDAVKQICKKYNICKKTLYNYLNKFKGMI